MFPFFKMNRKQITKSQNHKTEFSSSVVNTHTRHFSREQDCNLFTHCVFYNLRAPSLATAPPTENTVGQRFKIHVNGQLTQCLPSPLGLSHARIPLNTDNPPCRTLNTYDYIIRSHQQKCSLFSALFSPRAALLFFSTLMLTSF